MIPIFQDGYVIPNDHPPEQPVEMLFSYDGVHLLEIYREYALLDLAKRILNTVSKSTKNGPGQP